MQHENNATWAKYRDRAKFGKKSAKEECTIVRKRIACGVLYTGFTESIKMTANYSLFLVVRAIY